jgi:hypothetical protein
VIAGGVALYLASAIQQSLDLHILGARPDLILVVAIALSLVTSRAKAALTGFLAGTIHGALAGANLAAYGASRAIAGFATSWSKAMGYELTLPWIMAVAFLATVLAEIVWMFVGIRSGIGSFLGATIGTALYNAVLAPPLYALVKRAIDPPRR